MKIMTVVGARPQFIKAAPLSRALRKSHREVLVHTGQHYDRAMSQQFFDQMGIPRPDHNLEVGSGSHGLQTGQMLIRLEPLMLKEKPDAVVVFGDTNSTLAGALAAAKLHIPVAHIEAGMRSFNRLMPEELNRVAADHLSDVNFCSTRTAVMNLKREGVTGGVHLVGDIMVDSLNLFLPEPAASAEILGEYGVAPGSFLLATIHRAENTDSRKRLGEIVSALSRSDYLILFPAHPRTLARLKSFGLLARAGDCEKLRLIPPLGYVESLALQSRARAVITDSGGVQKEAYLLRTPCLTVRTETEWVETVESGWNRLVGVDREKIARALRRVARPRSHPRLYGNGKTAERIVACLERRFGR
ncbi:MAG TPA: UDP-N-acetylglucosamine 2-epimerase (non-hydrolyzing) [candidate division Zixibacteria bacterium]|nr:UDP-N-acetylglucosamine 2-epimerase (non-hydrolyzing) [candidate division Zixibacteria bacterium]